MPNQIFDDTIITPYLFLENFMPGAGNGDYQGPANDRKQGQYLHYHLSILRIAQHLSSDLLSMTERGQLTVRAKEDVKDLGT
jgi:hypothetical protein